MADDCIQYFIKYDVIQKSAVVSQSYAKAILVILFAVKLRSATVMRLMVTPLLIDWIGISYLADF